VSAATGAGGVTGRGEANTGSGLLGRISALSLIATPPLKVRFIRFLTTALVGTRHSDRDAKNDNQNDKNNDQGIYAHRTMIAG
jgi:hypothetical protein